MEFSVRLLLGTIALLEVIILLFQGQLFTQRKELKKLLESKKLGQGQDSPLDINKGGSNSSSQYTLKNKQ